ncbi:MAG: hypothetical protein ACLQBQ_12925 [Smithella sp.]
MNNDIKSFFINIFAGILTAIVFLYLDKNGFTSLSYIVFGCYLLFIGLAIYKLVFSKKEINTNSKEESNNKEKTNKCDHLETQINHITLDDTAVNILCKLWKFSGGLTDISISKILELDLQIAKYHLEKLEKQRMVHGTITVGEPRIWSLIHKGREYLIENKLNS